MGKSRKKKAKVKVKAGAHVVRKDSVQRDSIPVQNPRTNGAVMKVKIKKK